MVAAQFRGQRVVVIGAGAGGLSAAMRLAARGLEVTVCERAPEPGGKMRRVAVEDRWLDAGPTVFTMRWVFESLFQQCGLAWPEALTLTPLTVLARHAWLDGGRLDLFAEPARTADAIGTLSGASEARRYLAFARDARRAYQSLEGAFIRASRPSPIALARRSGPRGLACLATLAPYRTLWRALGRHFHDPRLRQLFARYATYVGSSPFQAPATLMLIAHVERDGVWQIAGGMHTLARVLAESAERLGARLRYATHVERITLNHGRVSGVRLANGEQLVADAVVCNADVSALGTGALGDDLRRAVTPTPAPRRSASAITWNLVARAGGFPLSHHNVFFGDDYREEFDAVFTSSTLPRTPTVYVCAQDRVGDERASPTIAAGTRERLLCLVNAPAVGDSRADGQLDAAIERCEQRTFEMLARCGLTVDRSAEATLRTTPVDFERLFPATGGALYGAACHGWLASFTRPGARTRVPGLYLTGGSVHPGPGVPMATLSGQIAADSVVSDLATGPAPTLSWRAS